MRKFPDISSGNLSGEALLAFEGIPYAKYQKVRRDNKQHTGFLTENSFLFVLEGKRTFYFEDKQVILDKNNFLLIKRGVYTISDFAPEEKFFEVLMIFLPAGALNKIHSEMLAKGIAKDIDEPFIVLPMNDVLRSFWQHYLLYFQNSFDNLKEVLELKLHELFLILISGRQRKKIINYFHSVINSKPLDIEFTVRKNLFHPLSLEELADLSGRSLAAFKRDFQKKFNTSPKQWINGQRLAYSMALLKATDLNVSEISGKCGYENVSHFIKLFRKVYSITPHSVRSSGHNRKTSV